MGAVCRSGLAGHEWDILAAAMYYYKIQPVPAPRQSQRDKFNPSASVQRYRAFKDEVRLRKVVLPSHFYHLIFFLAMPQSWSENKKSKHLFTPHRQKPDRDNLEKALLDAIYDDDAHIWDGRTSKLWSIEDGIYVGCQLKPLWGNDVIPAVRLIKEILRDFGVKVDL